MTQWSSDEGILLFIKLDLRAGFTERVKYRVASPEVCVKRAAGATYAA